MATLDYRLVLDSFADAVVAANIEGQIVYVNAAAERLLGWAASDLLGESLTALIPPRLRPLHQAGFDRYRATRKPRLIGHPVRVPALARDGSEIDVELSLSAFQVGEEGDLFVAALRDLRDRVELERQSAIGRYLRATSAAAARLTSRLDLQHLTQTVADTLVDDFDAALARIWLYEPATHTLHLRASAGLSKETETSSRARIDVATYPYKVGEVARTGKPFIRNGLADDPQFDQEWVAREGIASVAAFPLAIAGRLRGVIVHFSARRPLPDEVVQALSTFVAIVTAALNDIDLLLRQHSARVDAEVAEHRYRQLVDNLPDAIVWEADAETGRVTFVSHSAEALLGFPIARWQNEPRFWQEHLHPEDREGAVAARTQQMESGRDFQLEYRMVAADGRILWLKDRVQVFRDAHGAARQLRGLMVDITARKATELAMRESKEWLSTTLASIADAVIVTDAEGRITFLNRAATGLTGWNELSAVGRPLREVFRIVDEGSREPADDPVKAVLESDAVIQYPESTLLIARDGSEVAIGDSAAPIRDARGRVAGVVLVFRDVTQRKRDEAAQQLLAEASDALASSLDYETTLARVARLAVPRLADWCVVDMRADDGSIRRLAVAHVDPEKEALGWEVERRYPIRPDAPGGAAKVLRTGEPELVPHLPAEQIERAPLAEEHRRILLQLGLTGYMVVPLLARGAPIGAITFVSAESGRRYNRNDLALAQELARRAATAVEHARLYRDAQQANEAKDRFLAVLSHELRTPLTPIQASVELLRRVADDPGRVRHTAEVIERNVRLQANLVNDILDLSRITRGKLSLSRHAVDLRELVAQTLDGLQTDAERAGLRLVWDPPAEEVCAAVDPFRIQQVLLNLVGNAIKYTPTGGRVGVRIETAAGELGEVARLSVEDTGIGIQPEALSQIFRMFHQEESGVARRGLGIGLALVDSLVRMHGGRVWAESDGPGNGSRFTVELPAAGAGETDPTPAGMAEAPAANGDRPALLLVEDSEDSRETLVEALELLGYDVRQASSAEEALSMLKRWRPDAILSDIGLPGEDGCALIRQVRRMRRFARVLAVAVTGYGTDEDREEALAAGFDAHVAKPLDLAALDRQLRELLRVPRKKPEVERGVKLREPSSREQDGQ